MVNNQTLGDDLRIKRLMKAASKIKPSRARYESLWDPACVLNKLKAWYPLDSLSLEDLTYKLAALLALCTAHKVQTFSVINLDKIRTVEHGIEIYVTDNIKTSGIGKAQPCLYLPRFNDQPELCIVSTLEEYILKTSSLRKNNEKLLISFKKPHQPVTTQTIARWIKHVLQLSGVDITRFSAHSARHVATSTAFKQSVDLERIRKIAGWTSSSVFAKFYNRKIDDRKEFMASIMNK